jgi:uncharacterized protein
MLFLQGTRDALADTDLLKALATRATLKLFPDADHSFHVQVLGELLDALAAWVGGLGKGDAI